MIGLKMANFQLTALGTSPAWYNPGDASSGYLLEVEGFRLLVDCGSGVIPRYLSAGPGAEAPIDAIYISHIHPDHCFDLVPLKYGMTYGGLDDWRPQLWLPPGGHERLQSLAGAWDGDRSFYTETYDVEQYATDEQFDIGPFRCRTTEVPHFIESFALRCDHDGAGLCYSSDLGPTPKIVQLAQGADLFLCEATLSDASDESPDNRGHLSAREAGAIARDAGVGSLLLSHMPVEVREQQPLDDARSVYDGPVALAESFTTYPVGSPRAQATRSQ